MKKYIPVFGDQSLFDGAPEDAEYAGWFCQEVRWYMILNGKILFSDGGSWCTSDNPYLSADIAAIRRIIKEPKRWTWEDKKAGRLPEVGAKCSHCHSVDERTVLSVTDKYVGIERDNSDMNPYFVTHAGFLQYYIPIETPAEKAQREEDEFVDAIMSENLGISKPTQFKAGIRAAYRKLKGGE
jgi:hypothetical protein